MARMLGPAEYGVLAVLMSLIYFIAIPSESIQTLISKYTSKLSAKSNYRGIKYLLAKMLKKGTRITILIFLLMIPFFYFYSYFLNIDFYLVLLTGTMIFSVFLLPTTRGVMQGMKKFNSLGINMVLEAILKLIIAVILIALGIKTYGAVIGIIGGSIIAFVFSLIPLRKILSTNEEKIDSTKIYEQSTPIFFALIAILLMQSIDVIIAKRVFSPDIAGQYAVANLMGKIIFFGTVAISKTMLPLTSERFETGISTRRLFFKALGIVSVLCLIALILFAFFPQLIVEILFGEEYLQSASIVLNMGIAFSFISLANLVLIYGVSINKKIKVQYLIIVLVAQIILLTLSSFSLYYYSISMAFSGLLLFISSIIIIKKREIV
jgi:O-antigen/teichoic acid export membrane protein